MYNYPNFEAKVVDAFSAIIENYKLNVISNSTPSNSQLLLINDKCALFFTYNTGELSCTFFNPKGNHSHLYPVYSIWRYLYPDDTEDYSIGDWDFDKQLTQLRRVISERLSKILEGDFSWSAQYSLSKQYHSMKVEKMMKTLPKDHPIVKKYWNGDTTWESDWNGYESEASY